MEKIIIIPYESVKEKRFDEVEIDISNINFSEIKHKEGRITFLIEDCDFKKILIVNRHEILFKEISIGFNYCFIENIQIEALVSKKISFLFYSSFVNGSINSALIRDMSLNNCFAEGLYLNNQQRVNISYTEENIFPIRWKNFLARINIASIKDLLQIKQSIGIYNSKNIQIITNEIGKIKRGIYRDRIPELDEYKIGYRLSAEQKKMTNINISIKYSNSIEDSETRISDCFFNSLSISGESKGRISVEKSIINNLYISNFSARQEALFFLISPNKTESRLSIHRSNLENTWFDNIDFNGYTILSFYRTRIANASFSSCNFPSDNLSFEKFKTLENIHYPEKKPQNYYKDQYETFLQLKQSLTNSGNTYEAQKLNAISKESLRRIPDVSIWDKAILWINAKSNNHNLSIKNPFLGLIGCSISLYILYLISIGRIFNTGEIDWSLVGHYFIFLDLTHRKDFLISNTEFNFWTLFIDFTNKIFVGFFIYQFIAAFRKYGKK